MAASLVRSVDLPASADAEFSHTETPPNLEDLGFVEIDGKRGFPVRPGTTRARLILMADGDGGQKEAHDDEIQVGLVIDVSVQLGAGSKRVVRRDLCPVTMTLRDLSVEVDLPRFATRVYPRLLSAVAAPTGAGRLLIFMADDARG